MRSFAVLVAAASILPVQLSGASASGASASGASAFGASAPHANVLVLEAAGKPVTTAFASNPDHTYTISVTGVYTFNGTTGLGFADCGHKDPEGPTGWINVGNVLVNNRVAPCSLQPPSSTHRYSWVQPGTGTPLTFVIFANVYTGDDTGCLLVTVTDDQSPATPGTAGSGIAPSALTSTCWRLT